MPHSHLRVALAAALTACLPANAAEWVAEPSVNLRQTYDDNIRLTNANHDSVWGTTLDPRLKLSRRSDLWDVNASARLRSSKYFGEDGLDTNDNFLDAAVKRQFERGSIDTSASLVNDTTLQNEILDEDTGLTVNQIDRTRQNLRLAGEYTFTEATWVEASVDYSTLEYDQGLIYGLQDYDSLTPELRVIHQLDSQTQVYGILNHTKVEYDLPSPFESESKTNSLQLGAAYDITETWKVSGSVGSRKTESSQVTVETISIPFIGLISRLVSSENESTGLVYNASLTREFETGRLAMNASQSVNPSSSGTDTESTQLGFTGIREFSTKLSAQLAVSYYQSSTVGDVTTTADNTRYRVSPTLSWHLDEDLTLNSGYSFTRIKRDVANDEATDSNAVFASLAYTWPRISVSR